MAWTVTSAVVAGILEEARRAHPQECCGLLFGTDRAVTAYRPAANVHATPETHFEIDPQMLIDAHRAMRRAGPRLVGYYHSHPQSAPEPSAADRALAAWDEMIWVIVGLGKAGGELRAWRAGREGFSPLSYMTV